MRSEWFIIPLILSAASAAFAQDPGYPRARVSFTDYKDLVAQVEAHRASRLIDLDTFLRMSRDSDVVILDTRSDLRYERVHVKGARHLAFTDFTQDNLANAIPSPGTTILIYCNNNFEGNATDFATKSFAPRAAPAPRPLDEQTRPRMLALNVPTYINLYGYGYRNVYELDELVDVKDPRIEFEGATVWPLRRAAPGH